MADAASGVKLVEVSELFEYPIRGDSQLTGHFFTRFHHDKWLNSGLRLKASPDVRGLALDLFFLAQKQSPLGTLPDCDLQLSKLLHLNLEVWTDYRGRDVGPLYKWRRCQCGDEVRLYHPFVLEVLEDTFVKRDEGQERAERGVAARRMQRLPDQMKAAGASAFMCQDRRVVEWIDEWLLANCKGNRTPARVTEAMEAHSIAAGA